MSIGFANSVDNKGFTLIELVIALVLLGLIIAITAPLLTLRYQELVAQSAAEQTVNQLHAIHPQPNFISLKPGHKPQISQVLRR